MLVGVVYTQADQDPRCPREWVIEHNGKVYPVINHEGVLYRGRDENFRYDFTLENERATVIARHQPDMFCLAVRRFDGGSYEYLICSGMHMGRWTHAFGVNCLADFQDNKVYAQNVHAETPGSEVVHFCISQR